MTPAQLAALAALTRDALALLSTPADDPRRVEFQAQKSAWLAEVER